MVARRVEPRKALLKAVQQRAHGRYFRGGRLQVLEKLAPQRGLVDANGLAFAHDLAARGEHAFDMLAPRTREKRAEGIVEVFWNVGGEPLVVDHDEVSRCTGAKPSEPGIAANRAGAGRAARVQQFLPREGHIEAGAGVQQV